MVTCETILEKAKEYNVDVIGLSSLITLSLDEMVDVTKQMSKGGFKRPLMIGGATISKNAYSREDCTQILYDGPSRS
jgi:5-methyltetrahydrofolate--homocysteine methyltransferase